MLYFKTFKSHDILDINYEKCCDRLSAADCEDPSVSGDLVFMGKQSDQHPQALIDPGEFRMNWSAVHKRQHESYQHRLHI